MPAMPVPSTRRPSSLSNPGCLLLAVGLAAAAALPAGAQSPATSGASPAGSGDASAGGMAFMQCADCHATTSSNAAGPGLRGIVGRTAGKAPGFQYSAAMAKSTLTWDAKSLDAFLANPKTALPGTSMDFPGVTDPAERANLIAYLATLK
jgi:cytochrome c